MYRNSQHKPLLLALLLALTFAPPILGQNAPRMIITPEQLLIKQLDERLRQAVIKKELYEIKTLASEIDFKGASVEEKCDVYLAYFQEKKNAIIREVVGKFLTSTLFKIFFCIAVVVVDVALFINNAKLIQWYRNASEMLQNIVATLGPSIILLLHLPHFSIFTYISLTMIFYKHYTNPAILYQEVAPLEERYMSVKWELLDRHQDMVNYIEDSLINIRKNVRREELITMVKSLLPLATYTRNRDLLGWNEKEANNMLKNFKPHIREAIKAIAFNIRQRMNLFKTKDVVEPYTVVLYGPPGTGKSYLAKCIAKMIEVPSFEVDLGVSNDILFGGQRPGTMTQGIMSVMSQKHGPCAICICNDTDRDLKGDPKSWQLYLLDNSQSTYRDLCFNLKVDKPKAFIFTVNSRFKDDALSNRTSIDLDIVDPFTQEGLYMVLSEHMKKLIDQYKHLPHSLNQDDFTATEWKDIIQRAIKEKEDTQDQGIRKARNYIEAYFNEKTKAKFQKEAIA